MPTRPSYQPIEDYGAIGNLRTAALVGRNGSIDWLCVPDFDSPAVFAAILDSELGGSFRISPAGKDIRGEQTYLGDSNVLRTTFETGNGRLMVTDFFPLYGDIEGCGGSEAPPAIYRLIEADADVDVEVRWAPRFDYSRASTVVERSDGMYIARGGGQSLYLTGVPPGESRIVGDRSRVEALQVAFALEAGVPVGLCMGWSPEDLAKSPHEIIEARATTVDVWETWVRNGSRDRTWAEPWSDLVTRSELALKLLTHADTGAVVAAATTSLPETMGGVRNWDYRYAWIRDAAMTGQAFVAMGHHSEMQAFVNWAEHASRAEYEKDGHFKIMYSVHGDARLPEETLPGLHGYRGSQPVRIGNDAVGQVQHDILGELMDAAHELIADGMELEDDIWTFLPLVAEQACELWREPDHGIWEMRREPQEYTYSKLMTWVALDRAVQLAERNRLPGDTGRWRSTAKEVRKAILERGYSEKKRSFVQTFESDDLDAATLKIPIEGLLPFDDPRIQNTADRVREELMDNGLVRRYVIDDGLPGKEGGWVVCTTWLVDVLALSGRTDEASEILEGVARRANHVGLFSEQIDPRTGAFLGNFPQAFSHVGFIDSAVFVAHAQGREVPTAIPPGSTSARRQRSS